MLTWNVHVLLESQTWIFLPVSTLSSWDEEPHCFLLYCLWSYRNSQCIQPADKIHELKTEGMDEKIQSFMINRKKHKSRIHCGHLVVYSHKFWAQLERGWRTERYMKTLRVFPPRVSRVWPLYRCPRPNLFFMMWFSRISLRSLWSSDITSSAN